MCIRQPRWHYRYLAYIKQIFTGYALVLWIGSFLLWGVFCNQWKPLLSFILGIVPAMMVCSHITRTQQLWDLTAFAELLWSEAALSHKFRTLFFHIAMLIVTQKDYKSNDGDQKEVPQLSLSNGWALNSAQSQVSSSSSSSTFVRSIRSWVEDILQRFLTRTRDRLNSTSPSIDDQSPLASDSYVPYGEVIDCEIERFVNLITRDYVQSWYKVVCSDSSIVVDIHDGIREILLDLSHRARRIDRLSSSTEVVTMCREHLMKYQTACAIYKIQMSYAMSTEKSFLKNKLPGSVEDVFDQKYSLHPACKDTESCFDHVRALLEFMIDCMHILPAHFKNVIPLKKILVEIFTLQVVLPLIDMFQQPDFLHESIILLLCEEPQVLAEVMKHQDGDDDDDDDFEEDELLLLVQPSPPKPPVPPPSLPLPPPVVIQGSTPETPEELELPAITTTTTGEAIRPNTITLDRRASCFDEPGVTFDPWRRHSVASEDPQHILSPRLKSPTQSRSILHPPSPSQQQQLSPPPYHQVSLLHVCSSSSSSLSSSQPSSHFLSLSPQPPAPPPPSPEQQRQQQQQEWSSEEKKINHLKCSLDKPSTTNTSSTSTTNTNSTNTDSTNTDSDSTTTAVTGESTFENMFGFRSREGSRISFGVLPFLFGSDSRKSSLAADSELISDQIPASNSNCRKKSTCSAADNDDDDDDSVGVGDGVDFSVCDKNDKEVPNSDKGRCCSGTSSSNSNGGRGTPPMKPADFKEPSNYIRAGDECVNNKQVNCDNKSSGNGVIRDLGPPRNSFCSSHPISDKLLSSEKESNSSNKSNFVFGLRSNNNNSSSKGQRLNGMKSKCTDSTSPTTLMKNTFERSPFQTLWPNSSIPRLSQTEDSIRTYPFISVNNSAAETSSKTDSESEDSGPTIYKRCLFHNISIVETEIHKELRTNKVYTLYEIQYNASYVSESSGEFSTKIGRVKRRYREFCTLQQKLEEKNVYKKCLKDIKGPNRWQHTLFGNMDQENVTQRRKFLDNYLKNLIKKEMLCNGPELREFLAYEGDAHIAYVKRTREINMPRIDKAIVKTVSGVLDRIATTVLPRSMSQDKTSPSGYQPNRKDSMSPNKPCDEEVKIIEDSDQILVDIDIPNYESWFRVVESHVNKQIENIKCRRDSSTEVTNRSCSSPPSPLSTNQSCSSSHTPSVRNQGHSLSTNPPTTDLNVSSSSLHSSNQSSSLPSLSLTNESSSLPGSSIPTSTNESISSPLSAHSVPDAKPSRYSSLLESLLGDTESDSAHSIKVQMKNNLELTSAMLDFAVQALQGCDSWLNKEAAYEMFAIVSGTVLNNWLQKNLNEATSQTQCRYYLQLLRERLWPNSKNDQPATPKKTPAQIEATKESAKQYIFDTFPALLVLFIGEDNLQHAITQLFTAIQHQKLNRHFLFCLLDVFFLYLFPEVKSEEFRQFYENINVREGGGKSFSSDDIAAAASRNS
ncbi:hypothetical protein Ahia01_001350300 [Argonauta hians]